MIFCRWSYNHKTQLNDNERGKNGAKNAKTTPFWLEYPIFAIKMIIFCSGTGKDAFFEHIVN